MIFIRYLLAIALFISGLFILIQWILQEYNFIPVLIALACFMLAYWVKPSACEQDVVKKQKQDQRNTWVDWIDFPIELVFQLITQPFRLIGKLLKSLDFDF